MNVDLLEQITRLMRDNDLNTVDVRDGDKRVILKRGAAVAADPGAGCWLHAPRGAHAPASTAPACFRCCERSAPR